jgi:hypothetical protein
MLTDKGFFGKPFSKANIRLAELSSVGEVVKRLKLKVRFKVSRWPW